MVHTTKNFFLLYHDFCSVFIGENYAFISISKIIFNDDD